MIDIINWINTFIHAVNDTFGNRTYFVGINGSSTASGVLVQFSFE